MGLSKPSGEFLSRIIAENGLRLSAQIPCFGEDGVFSLYAMSHRFLFASLVCATTLSAFADAPRLPGIRDTMQELIAGNEIAGAITVVVTTNQCVHFESDGLADVATKRPMKPDTLFWIASMTKPITGVAVLMLQDEGKLNVADRVAKYLPEFADLKTPSGKPADLTIAQLLTPTPPVWVRLVATRHGRREHWLIWFRSGLPRRCNTNQEQNGVTPRAVSMRQRALSKWSAA